MRAVLTYHSIDDSGSVISVTPDSFARHVAWLAGGSVRVVGLEDLLTLPNESHAVTLTFDDALASIATEAAPRLADLGLAATVFVVSDHVGGDNAWGGVAAPGIPPQPVLDWDAIGRLADAGWTVGSHSRRHPHLVGCNDDQLEDELATSAATIARHLGDRPTSFAYPYGDVDPRIATAVARHYAHACTASHQVVTDRIAPHLIPRLDAWYFRGPEPFRHWGTPRFRRAVAWRHALRRARRSWQ